MHTAHKHALSIHQPTISSITTVSEDDIITKGKSDLVKLLLQAREEVYNLTQETQGLTQEIHVLTQALAVSGKKLGLEQDSDLRSVLLYDLALSQQARATLAIDLARRTEKLKNLQKTVSTLSFVRESNNLELVKCERKIKELEQQLASQRTQVSIAAQNQEKFTSLVAAHHQLSEQLSSSQLRAATTERERDHLASQIPRLTLLSQDVESQRAQSQAQHQQQLDTLRAEHVKQLDVLREQHKLHMDAAQEQHAQREQLSQKEVERYQQQLAVLREQHIKQIEGEQALRDKRDQQERKEIEHLTKQYEYELGRLRTQLEQANSTTEKESSRLKAEYASEKGKLHDKLTESTKEAEKLKIEIAQLKSQEGETQGKLATLRAEYSRQGRMNSFQEVVGTQMANVRSQLEEAKQMYSRVNAENALLASENARLLVLLDEEIKSRSDSVYGRASSPHVTSRPASTPPLMRTSSFVDSFTPSSLKIPPGSSPLSMPSRPSSAPHNFTSSSSPSSPEIPRRQKQRPKPTSSSNPASRSSTPDLSDLHSSSDFTEQSSNRSTSPLPAKPKPAVKRSPLLARRAAARTPPASSLSHSPIPTTPDSAPTMFSSASPNTFDTSTLQFTSTNPLPSLPSMLMKSNVPPIRLLSSPS